MVRFAVSWGFVTLLVVGCGGGTPQGGPTGPSGGQDVAARLPGGPEHEAGKKAYAAADCARCHQLGETGGGPPGGKAPPGRGPDLTKAGADGSHTKQWLAEHIRDAKAHKPGSRMPPFGADRINDADLDALAAYLASLK